VLDPRFVGAWIDIGSGVLGVAWGGFWLQGRAMHGHVGESRSWKKKRLAVSSVLYIPADRQQGGREIAVGWSQNRCHGF